MLIIPLQAIPCQSFSVNLDGNVYNMTIRFLINFMAIDIARNNIPILSGWRLVPQYPIIPFRYIEASEGNFAIITFNNDYPNYNQFGVNQIMVYANPSELEALRAAA